MQILQNAFGIHPREQVPDSSSIIIFPGRIILPEGPVCLCYINPQGRFLGAPIGRVQVIDPAYSYNNQSPNTQFRLIIISDLLTPPFCQNNLGKYLINPIYDPKPKKFRPVQ